MSSYFFLHLLDEGAASVAHAEDDPDRDAALCEPGRVEEWCPLSLRLTGREAADYLANNAGARLCSPLLRDVIDEHLTPEHGVQWLDAAVVDRSGQRKPYFVLHFTSHPDVLDERRSITARGNFVVKPVIARSRAEAYHAFSFPGGSTRIIVSNQLKDAIEAAGCSGVDFAAVASV